MLGFRKPEAVILIIPDADNEYPDGDYKFHYLWVLEPVLELLRPDDAAYNRYKEVEQEMMLELAATARSV